MSCQRHIFRLEVGRKVLAASRAALSGYPMSHLQGFLCRTFSLNVLSIPQGEAQSVKWAHFNGNSSAGTEKLKEALAALGLKTGGTPQQRVERLWLTRDTPLTQLERKHFAKASAPAKTPEEAQKQRQAALEAALLEAKVPSSQQTLSSGSCLAQYLYMKIQCSGCSAFRETLWICLMHMCCH